MHQVAGADRLREAATRFQVNGLTATHTVAILDVVVTSVASVEQFELPPPMQQN